MNLELLDLSGNKITGTLPYSLSELEKLWVLKVSWNHLTRIHKDMPKPARLVYCNLEQNRFGCEIPEWSKQMCSADCY
jgi:hypothetical protein